ncbi:MAG: hypothetical protein ABFS86_17690, partial [Planctomycetota bacterium]
RVTEEDEEGKKLVAELRAKEPGVTKGTHVHLAARMLPGVRDLTVTAHLDPVVTKVAGWFDVKLEEFEPIAVRIDPADWRRSAVHAEIVVRRTTLARLLPKLADAPFPLPALSLLSDGKPGGGLMEAVGAGKVTDLTLDAVFATDGRVEIGWSLLRYLRADAERWKAFLAVTKKQDVAAIRKWLDGIEGLEAAWRKHVGTWKIETAEQYVDAAYVSLNARRMRRAAMLFSAAIDKGTKERGAFEGLAEIHVLDGRPGLARLAWEKALKADPLNVRARRSIGVYLSEKRSAQVGGLYLKLADEIEKALGGG